MKPLWPAAAREAGSPALTLAAVQRAGQRAGAPGQRPVDVAGQLLLGGRLPAAPVLPEAAALGGTLARLPRRLRLRLCRETHTATVMTGDRRAGTRTRDFPALKGFAVLILSELMSSSNC